MSQKGQFRCIHCGDRFDLFGSEKEDYENGYYDHTPDTCDDCCDMMNHPPHDLEHSDADPGL